MDEIIEWFDGTQWNRVSPRFDHERWRSIYIKGQKERHDLDEKKLNNFSTKEATGDFNGYYYVFIDLEAKTGRFVSGSPRNNTPKGMNTFTVRSRRADVFEAGMLECYATEVEDGLKNCAKLDERKASVLIPNRGLVIKSKYYTGDTCELCGCKHEDKTKRGYLLQGCLFTACYRCWKIRSLSAEDLGIKAKCLFCNDEFKMEDLILNDYEEITK